MVVLTALSQQVSAAHPIYSEEDLYVQDRDVPYALVKDYLTVTNLAEITDPSDEYSGLFIGTHNRSGNPVRINWYGDMDGLTAQKGVINDGRIYGRLFINAKSSGNTYETKEKQELKDYRSSIAPDGEANGIDAYGWVPVSNENDMIFALDKIENTGVTSGFAKLQTGAGTHRSIVVVNASANGVSLYGAGDFGKYIIGADGSEVAVDAGTGGSRSARSVRTATGEAATTTIGEIPSSLTSSDKNFYGKNIRVSLDKLENSGLIQGRVEALGNEASNANGSDDAQDYSITSWASGNGVSLRTHLITQDRRTYSYEKINEAKLGNVNNSVGGRTTGSGLLKSVAVQNDGSTNYTRSYDTGNGISVSAKTLRFAKDQTIAEIGDISNQGNISGHLVQLSADNNSRGLHNYSQSQAYGSGNGVNLFGEATQNILGPVDEYGMREQPGMRLIMGNINNAGRIDGFADLTAGNGYGVINVVAQGVGNGISTFLKAGAAQDYQVKVGNINNSGVISGYLKATAGHGGGGKRDTALANAELPRAEVELIITDNSIFNQNSRPEQPPAAPSGAVDCVQFGSSKHSDCRQTNAISNIRGSGNGISIYTGRASGDGTTVGDINNTGVISGYSEMYHGMSDAQYSRVDFLATGVGIAVDQAISSNITNKGIISGNHAALLAKSAISDAYNISEPNYQSGYKGAIKNYGLMAGALIAGNYNGNRPDGNPRNQTYLYFKADTDPVTNFGTYVYLAPRQIQKATASAAENAVRTDFLNPSASGKLSKLAEDIKRLKSAEERGTLFTTYKTFAVADIKKIEGIYGAASTLSDDDRINLYLKLYDAITDKKTADQYKTYWDRGGFLAESEWGHKEDRKEILAKKNQLINRKDEIAQLMAKLGENDTGFKNIYNQYIEYYNDQIVQLNQKLNKINQRLTEKFNDKPYAIIAENDGAAGESVTIKKIIPTPYGAIDRIETVEDSKQTIDGVEYSIINAPVSASVKDSEYIATASSLNNHIINGVGVEHGALVANKDLTLTNSVVNGFVTALNIQGNSTVTLDNTILNTNGFNVRVFNGESVEVKTPNAILGDDNANTVILRNGSVVNGDVHLNGGNDRFVVGDETVRINVTDHTLDFGSGDEDEFVLGEQITDPSVTPIKVDYTVAGAERLIVNQPSQIMANRMELPSYIELHNKLVYQAPTDAAISLHSDERAQPEVKLDGKTLKVGIRSQEAYGALEVENANLNVTGAKLIVDSSVLNKAQVEAGSWVIKDIVSVKRTIYQCGEDAMPGQNCDGYGRDIGIVDSYALIGNFASMEDNSAIFKFEEYHQGRDKDGNQVSVDDKQAATLAMNLRVKQVKKVEDIVTGKDIDKSETAPTNEQANNDSIPKQEKTDAKESSKNDIAPVATQNEPRKQVNAIVDPVINNSTTRAVARAMDVVINNAVNGNTAAVELARALGGLQNNQQVIAAVVDAVPTINSLTSGVVTGASRFIMSNVLSGATGIINPPETTAALNPWVPQDNRRDHYVWGKFLSNWEKHDKANGLAGYKTDNQGFILGGSKRVTKDFNIGVVLGYLKTKAYTIGTSQKQSLSAETWQGGLYSDWFFMPNVALETQLGYGHSSISVKRDQTVFNQIAKAKYGANLGYASIGVRYYQGNEDYLVTPFFRANYNVVKTDAYQETGAVTSLKVKANTDQSLTLQSGIDAEMIIGERWKVGGTLAAEIETLKVNQSIKASFAATPSETFVVQGLDKQRVQGIVGVRTEYTITPFSAVTLRYNANFGKKYLGQQVDLNFRFAF